VECGRGWKQSNCLNFSVTNPLYKSKPDFSLEELAKKYHLKKKRGKKHCKFRKGNFFIKKVVEEK
jgi:hypothetical protein